MTKLYFKYYKDALTTTDSNVLELVKKHSSNINNLRVRVIVEHDNYESPKVQIAEYITEPEESWKSGWWLLEETTWTGTFIPDETWECVEI